MTGDPVRRGQPLVALALVMAAWVGVRAALWENPFASLVRIAAPVEIAVSTSARRPARRPAPASGFVAPASGSVAPASGAVAGAIGPVAAGWRAGLDSARAAFVPPPAAPVPVRLAGAHQLAWMAVLAQLPMPPMPSQAGGPRTAGSDADRAAILPPAAFPVPVAQTGRAVAHPPSSRWSADGWLLVRGGSAGIGAAGLPMATYGGSQAGVVVRYRLAPARAARPVAYARATAALAGPLPRDREVAAGFAARLTGVPVAAAVELRLADRPGGAVSRPAAFVSTELPPFTLPHGLRAEAYAQAGAVGGPGGTAFVDGQARADRRLARVGGAEIRAGAGIWGGAQQGVARLDAGPAASVTIAGRGSASARLAMDWRFRVAGNAAPASGPALTLSAGF